MAASFLVMKSRKIAGTKLEQFRAQLKELARMRRQLEGILSDWDKPTNGEKI